MHEDFHFAAQTLSVHGVKQRPRFHVFISSKIVLNTRISSTLTFSVMQRNVRNIIE